MENQNNSLFEAQGQESASSLASALARAALPGHFDELRGQSRPVEDGPLRSTVAQPPLTPEWSEFFEHLGRDGFSDLNRRTAQLQRQIRDNGVTYNLYADADNPQRPWSLDLFPLIVSPESWQQVEAGSRHQFAEQRSVGCQLVTCTGGGAHQVERLQRAGDHGRGQ